ncbi:MAG: lipopolysaccharide transport periplasmic protein LptA [Gammaproteobacteria bacterium]|nr:MAG: lipopolysaccharide transport periplasmic protein LptA [Gammaproteobacteria bacterium]
MGVSLRNLSVAILAMSVLVVGEVRGILPDSQEPISLDADSSEFDRDSNTLIFRNVHITQGMLSIAAATASADGLDFADSSWQFDGNVRIDGEYSRIRAAKAVLRFRNHRMVHASASGEPANFERDATEDTRALSGGARSIDYDLEAQTLTLSGEAQLIDGQNEINGETLLYQLTEERLVATSDQGGDQRVRVTVTPQTLGVGGDPKDDEDPGTETVAEPVSPEPDTAR